MPGPCQAHVAPPVIVLGATGGSFLDEEEREKDCEFLIPLATLGSGYQDSYVGTYWPSVNPPLNPYSTNY